MGADSASSERRFKLALIQMRVAAGHPAENLGRALTRIEEAVMHGARVVVLPEAMNLGWTHGSAAREAEAIPDGPSCAALRRAAERWQIYLAAGLVERAGDRVFNSAVLIDPGGNVRLHHRKIYELEIAHDVYALGDGLAVARTPLGTFGLMICADAFAPGQVIARTLALMGADIILSPCAWAVTADHDNARTPYGQLWLDNYQPVARGFRLWIAGVSNVGWLTDGPWKGRKCIGCSLLIDPTGEPAVRGPYGEEAEAVLYAEVNLAARPARGDGWERMGSGQGG